MRARSIAVASLALILCPMAFLARPAAADDKPAGGDVKGVRAEVLRSLDDAEKKLTALADAMPADKYGWRPGEGVRSVGEVFMHVAGANYFLSTLGGGTIPEGLDPRGFEKEGNDKPKVIATMKASFNQVRKVIESTPDADLDKTVHIFDHDGTMRELFLAMAMHAHEHLGQSIAYARMNHVTPPWSAGGQ